jgi:hypothetical protein
LNSLWAEELPANTTIVLSAEDSLVPSCRVRRHLELHAPHAQVHWLSGLNHAHFLMHPSVTARIAELIARRTA